LNSSFYFNHNFNLSSFQTFIENNFVFLLHNTKQWIKKSGEKYFLKTMTLVFHVKTFKKIKCIVLIFFLRHICFNFLISILFDDYCKLIFNPGGKQ